MSKRLKFEFDKTSESWDVRSLRHKEYLGEIEYNKNWKKHVFEGFTDCFFDAECLQEVIDFMKKLDKKKLKVKP